jgi:transposase
MDQRQTLLTHSTTAGLCSDYLACCYLFEDSFNCIEEIIRIHGRNLADENLIHQFLDLMRLARSPRMGESVIDLLRDFHLLDAAEGDADETSVFLDTPTQDRMLFHAYLSGIYVLLPCLDNKAQRHLGRLRQIRDELGASPSCSLGMWSILFLQQESSQRDTPDILLERLDIDDEEFLHFFQVCLSLCKECLEIVEQGVSSHAPVQFDSLFLQTGDAAISLEICRLMQKQSRLDTWQEAGFLFAFVWGNAQQETSISSSWQKQVKISDISTMHFLAIICRMIIHQTTISYPDLENGFAPECVTEQFISLLYLDTIEHLMTTRLSPRDVKRDFLQHFTKHHTWSELEPEDNGSIKRVQNYQQRVLDDVIRHNIDSAKDHSSVQETPPQAVPSQTDVRMIHSISLGSNKSNNSSSRSASSSHVCQRYLSSLSNNPTMTRSPASGSSRGSSLNSFRRFQAASAAITIHLKERQGSHMQSLDEQGSST